jgi:acetate kinase
MQVLVINSGSSSLKFRFIDTSSGAVLARGLIDRIGEGEVPDHRAALRQVLAAVDVSLVEAVGHRAVHGGERFREATRVTPEMLAELGELSKLAPLHNPPALEGMRAAGELLPHLPMVAVFDTAFHATLPRHAFPVRRAALAVRAGRRAALRLSRHESRVRVAGGGAGAGPRSA